MWTDRRVIKREEPVVERNRREDRNATWRLVFIRDAENVYCKSICPWLIAMLFTLEMACFLLERY
jgi:hypothetical protein